MHFMATLYAKGPRVAIASDNRPSLTMSAVSRSFRAHYCIHSTECAISALSESCLANPSARL